MSTSRHGSRLKVYKIVKMLSEIEYPDVKMLVENKIV